MHACVQICQSVRLKMPALLYSIVPLIPTGFNFTSEYQQLMDTTVTFEWNPAQGSGPEAVVDYYIIYITPSPPSHPSTNQVESPPWNVTLAHNTIYSINITAVNCAGESDAFVLPDIGKDVTFIQ